MAVTRNISYLSKDFNSFRNELINFTKTYFPNTYTDFSAASPGMMFMEQASYIGDVLSFYLDNQVQENFIQYSRQTSNLYNLAYMFGYTPRIVGLSNTNIELFQLIPSKISGSTYIPDFDYALNIPENNKISTNTTEVVNFTIQDNIDFSISNSIDPTEITIAQTSGGNPTRYLLKKTRQAVSGEIKTTTFSFNEAQEFSTVNINDTNIAQILDVIDSDGNVWYEVDYLGQDFVYDSIKNTNTNDPNYSINSDDTPYILKLKSVQRRFVTRFLNKETLQIQFGSGDPSLVDEEILPNPTNVGLGLPQGQSKLTTAFSPTNFILTNSYGVAPSNTTLTVRYITGGGIADNVDANTIVNIDSTNVQFLKNTLDNTLAQTIFNSLQVNNPNAADGGRGEDTIEELRQNIAASYGTQLRAVTADDYLIRALSLPSQYGVVAKAFAQQPNTKSNSTVDIFVLSYDSNSKLKTASTSLKTNIKTYLSQYRSLGDSINIKNAYVVNIAVDFEIITLPNYNNNEVLNKCLTSLKNYFDISKWGINQPILIPKIKVLLDNIDGVQTVKNVKITNKTGTNAGYSSHAYDVLGATQNEIVYPSIDPSIFEIKYPDQDITGRVVIQ